jgi:hypothetical protein
VTFEVAPDLTLTPLEGQARTIQEWTTTFHLVAVALDPYTYESAWILDRGGKILRIFAEADCRVSFLVTCSADEAREFLGPWAKEFLTFVDPDRSVVRSLGLERLPALVHVNMDHQVEGKAEGWQPDDWREVTDHLAKVMSWSRPTIPEPGDPVPYEGTPA